ncbi:MAG: hypothetical protein AB1401_00775 [Thermodesulfobacteriota bacterium]
MKDVFIRMVRPKVYRRSDVIADMITMFVLGVIAGGLGILMFLR